MICRMPAYVIIGIPFTYWEISRKSVKINVLGKFVLGKPNTLLLVYGAGKGQPGSPKQFLEDFVLVLSSCQLFLPFPC